MIPDVTVPSDLKNASYVLKEEFSKGLRKIIIESLSKDEIIQIALKGQYEEALICTDRRIIIAKRGFSTGNFLGSNIFQIHYTRITSVDVTYGVISGYFQILAGGISRAENRTLTIHQERRPQNAPNCVSLCTKKQAALFRSACSYIMDKISAGRMPSSAV